MSQKVRLIILLVTAFLNFAFFRILNQEESSATAEFKFVLIPT